jgi:hypothetical protein
MVRNKRKGENALAPDIQNTWCNLLYKFTPLIFMASVSAVLAAHSFPAIAQETVKTWEERFTFDRGGNGRPGPHEVDPNIWVYTEEFSKRFGMPRKWVDDQLIGAEAIA